MVLDLSMTDIHVYTPLNPVSVGIPVMKFNLASSRKELQVRYRQNWNLPDSYSQQNLHAKYSSKYLSVVCLTMPLNEWMPVNDLRRLWKEMAMVNRKTLYFLERLKTITKNVVQDSRCFSRDSNREFPNTSQKRHHFNHLVKWFGQT
jgi:hypothetical protein